MTWYGNPYKPDPSPVEVTLDKVCILLHLPSLDEVHYRWSETEVTDQVAVSFFPGYRDYILNTPQVALRIGEHILISRNVGKEMFNYLIQQRGWVKKGDGQ
jgi:hypothetical protein